MGKTKLKFEDLQEGKTYVVENVPWIEARRYLTIEKINQWKNQKNVDIVDILCITRTGEAYNIQSFNFTTRGDWYAIESFIDNDIKNLKLKFKKELEYLEFIKNGGLHVEKPEKPIKLSKSQLKQLKLKEKFENEMKDLLGSNHPAFKNQNG